MCNVELKSDYDEHFTGTVSECVAVVAFQNGYLTVRLRPLQLTPQDRLQCRRAVVNAVMIFRVP
jgi:hypothetical protein